MFLRLEQVKKDKKQKEKDKKTQDLHVKKQLSNMRIVQRNLVYVTNLSLSMAREEVSICSNI